jgi:hypothetical protein
MTLNSDTFELNYSHGIHILEGSATVNNGLVQNIVSRYNGASGINQNIHNQSGWQFLTNQLYDNAQIVATNGNDDWTWTAGLKVFCNSNSYLTNILISGNQSYSNGRLPLTSTAQGLGLWSDTCGGVTMQGNTIYGNASTGLAMEISNNSTVSYNVAYNNGSNICDAPAVGCLVANIALVADQAQTTNLVNFYQNTSYGGQIGLLCYSTGSGAEVANSTWINNIATGSAAGNESGPIVANFYFGPGCNNDSINGHGNAYTYHNLGANGSTNLAYWQGKGALTTYAALQAAYGATTHNVAGDPLFTSPGAGNFTLLTGSPNIGAGVYVTGVSTVPIPNIGAK